MLFAPLQPVPVMQKVFVLSVLWSFSKLQEKRLSLEQFHVSFQLCFKNFKASIENNVPGPCCRSNVYLVSIQWLYVYDPEARDECTHARNRSQKKAKRVWVQEQKQLAINEQGNLEP